MPIDLPPVEYSQPFRREENGQVIHLYDILSLNGLEQYFRNLTGIQRDKLHTLPSGNKFMVHHEGITFFRNGKEEFWKIRAENKGAGLHIDRLEHTPEGWKLWVTARKFGMDFKQDEPQILDRTEITHIFTAIEAGKEYTRPTYRPDGKPYQLILQVKRA